MSDVICRMSYGICHISDVAAGSRAAAEQLFRPRSSEIDFGLDLLWIVGYILDSQLHLVILAVRANRTLSVCV
jgi:hypothetical protein